MSLTSAGTAQGARRQGRARRSRDIPAPRPWTAAAAALGAAVGLVAVLILAIATETGSELSGPGGVATFLGNLTGLVGMYLALVMVLIASRIPWVERVLGQDGLLRWHRRISPWPISLIVAHALLTTFGYAQAGKTGFAHQLGAFITSYPDMLAATVGVAIFIVVGIASIRAIRVRLRRETWWALHLYIYLALALSFAHVIVLGQAFVGHPVNQAIWSAIWAATAGVVLTFRFGLPLLRTLRHRLRVVEVRPEADDVVSVILAGRRLERLAVAGGQFFEWRFLTRGLWWQAHPYTLSGLPRSGRVRLTVKNVGDHSAALATLPPGTKVAVEGPYGTFTHHARRRRRTLLIAGGIGVTAVRALLEDLPRSTRPVVVVRASSQGEVALGAELAQLAEERNGAYYELVGSRAEVALGRGALKKLVPDLRQRDVYVCGPPGFVHSTVDLVRRLGVAPAAIHHEAYAL